MISSATIYFMCLLSIDICIIQLAGFACLHAKACIANPAVMQLINTVTVGLCAAVAAMAIQPKCCVLVVFLAVCVLVATTHRDDMDIIHHVFMSFLPVHYAASATMNIIHQIGGIIRNNRVAWAWSNSTIAVRQVLIVVAQVTHFLYFINAFPILTQSIGTVFLSNRI